MCAISFIIPALNEADGIANTLKSIKECIDSEDYEIIVVDNGSTDDTVNIAESYGCKVKICPNATIAKLRNIGFEHSKGEILVFLDADVYLDILWYKNFKRLKASLIKNQLQVTGSRCLPENDNNFLTKYWYLKLTEYDAKYINSGHMVTTRKLFMNIGGFNEELVTAEDYDFCLRARKVGADVYSKPELKVYHTGYPENIHN